MRILKLPIVTRINCECGCEFEFDAEDVIVSTIFADNTEYNHYYIHCPLCKKTHNLNTKQEDLKRCCANCRYCEAIAYKDEITQEWITQFRCKKDRNTIVCDADSCEYFHERR